MIGRSDIVGKPMALMLLHANATVTICHSRTADLPRRRRDRGHPGRGDRPRRLRDAGLRQAWRDGHRRRHEPRRRRGDGAGLVPARLAAPRRVREEGLLLVGDVDPRVAAVAGALTPVPRRRRSADARHADEQHGRRRRSPRGATGRVTLTAPARLGSPRSDGARRPDQRRGDALSGAGVPSALAHLRERAFGSSARVHLHAFRRPASRAPAAVRVTSRRAQHRARPRPTASTRLASRGSAALPRPAPYERRRDTRTADAAAS